MKIINLGILAHVDAGKTTVTEGLLVHSGVKRQMGRVDDGTTTTDSMALEKARGMTIRASTVSFTWQDTKINLIDTPGHMDFIAEVERSLSVLDGVVLVISAREGVQPQTRVIFEKLRSMGIPTLLFVNKIDRMGVSLEAVYADIRKRLTESIVVMQAAEQVGTREAAVRPMPLHDTDSMETIIESDEALLAKYVEGEDVSEEMLHGALLQGVQGCRLYPVYLGAALRYIGIGPLLDAIVEAFGKEAYDVDAPLAAYIYKVEWGAYDHKWAYFRVFRGVLHMRERVPHVGHEEDVMVRGLMAARDGVFAPAEEIQAGDIGVLMDAPHVCCGDFLGGRVALPKGLAPSQPLLSVGLQPDPTISRNELLNALQRLTEEDPLLQMSIHPQTEEITLRLYGALQREIIQSLLLERFGIRAEFLPLKTLFREKPREEASAEIRIWGPGNLHEAGIALTLKPMPTGSGLSYETQVSFGDLLKTFQNAVEEGVLAGLQEGLDCELVDTKAIFTDMDFSSVTSTPADYRRLAPMVVRKALEAVPRLRLEPWLRFELYAPAEHQKKVLASVNQLRAVISLVEYGEEEFRVFGEAPLDTTKEYTTTLLSMTQGQGVFHTEFLEYREV